MEYIRHYRKTGLGNDEIAFVVPRNVVVFVNEDEYMNSNVEFQVVHLFFYNYLISTYPVRCLLILSNPTYRGHKHQMVPDELALKLQIKCSNVTQVDDVGCISIQ